MIVMVPSFEPSKSAFSFLSHISIQYIQRELFNMYDPPKDRSFLGVGTNLSLYSLRMVSPLYFFQSSLSKSEGLLIKQKQHFPKYYKYKLYTNGYKYPSTLVTETPHLVSHYNYFFSNSFFLLFPASLPKFPGAPVTYLWYIGSYIYLNVHAHTQQYNVIFLVHSSKIIWMLSNFQCVLQLVFTKLFILNVIHMVNYKGTFF